MKQVINQQKVFDSVEKGIERLRPVPERDPEATARGRAQFLTQAEELKPSVSPGPFQRLKEWLQTTFIGLRKERSPMFGTISAIILALALVFGGGGATVYAAQGSMPDALLYQLKLFSEDAQLNFTGDIQNKTQLLEQFIHRRFDEIEGLAMAGKEIPPEVTNRLQLQLETQLRLAVGMDDEEMQQTLERLQLMIRTRDQKMTMLNQPDHADPQLEQIRNMLQERLRLVQTGLEEPNMLRFQLGLQQNKPVESPQESPADVGGQGPGGDPEQPGPGPCEDCTPVNDGSGAGGEDGSQGPEGIPEPDGNGPGGSNEKPGSGNNPDQQGEPPSETPVPNGSGSQDSSSKPTVKPSEDKGEQNSSQDGIGNDEAGSEAAGEGDPQNTQTPPENQGGYQIPPDGSGGNGADSGGNSSFGGGIYGNGEVGGDEAGRNGGGGKP